MDDLKNDLEQIDEALTKSNNAIKYGGGLFTTAQMVKNVIYSLEQVTVSGRKNLDLVLGAILMLESVQRALEKKEAKQNDTQNE